MIAKVFIMLNNFLKKAIQRHLRETKLLVDQLNDQLVISKPVEAGRPLGEIFLHMLRSVEYYLRGLVNNIWVPLPYTLATYGTAQAIKSLYDKISIKVEDYLKQLTPNILTQEMDRFNRPATKAEILLELIEHSIHHRGQITTFYRLLGIEPASISYII